MPARTINQTGSFRRDLKRETKGRYAREIDALMQPIVEALSNNEPLPVRLRDHLLIGEWHGHRDCHVRPDLVLIYRFEGDAELHLVRLGSHGELGL